MKKKKADMLRDLLILRSLRGGSLNGWDIMNRIHIVSGEVLRVISGSLYPALHRLEAADLVNAEWGFGLQPAREVLQADCGLEETA